MSEENAPEEQHTPPEADHVGVDPIQDLLRAPRPVPVREAPPERTGRDVRVTEFLRSAGFLTVLLRLCAALICLLSFGWFFAGAFALERDAWQAALMFAAGGLTVLLALVAGALATFIGRGAELLVSASRRDQIG